MFILFIKNIIHIINIESSCDKICKSIETNVLHIDSLEKKRENLLLFIKKLNDKEKKMYHKLSTDSKLVYKYAKDKEKLTDQYYYSKLIKFVSKFKFLN